MLKDWAPRSETHDGFLWKCRQNVWNCQPCSISMIQSSLSLFQGWRKYAKTPAYPCMVFCGQLTHPTFWFTSLQISAKLINGFGFSPEELQSTKILQNKAELQLSQVTPPAKNPLLPRSSANWVQTFVFKSLWPFQCTNVLCMTVSDIWHPLHATCMIWYGWTAGNCPMRPAKWHRCH